MVLRRHKNHQEHASSHFRHAYQYHVPQFKKQGAIARKTDPYMFLELEIDTAKNPLGPDEEEENFIAMKIDISRFRKHLNKLLFLFLFTSVALFRPVFNEIDSSATSKVIVDSKENNETASISTGLPLFNANDENEEGSRNDINFLNGNDGSGNIESADGFSSSRGVTTTVESERQMKPISSSTTRIKDEMSAGHISQYDTHLQETLKPIPNVTTACHSNFVSSGLNSQVQRFIGLILVASENNIDQIIEESVSWKDTLSHKDLVPHHKLWDVVHWNTFFPTLPRFASYNEDDHPHLHLTIEKTMIGTQEFLKRRVDFNVPWDIWTNSTNTKPQPLIRWPQQANDRYEQLTKRVDTGTVDHNPSFKKLEHMYEKILQGALRPHPFLQGIIDKKRAELGGDERGYMIIHAHIEPDVARQDDVCAGLKVWNITDVINSIYAQYPKPPVSAVLIQFNRTLLVAGAQNNLNLEDKNHILNEYNLKEINKLTTVGMWDGIKVVEAGSDMVEEAGDPYYNHYYNIAGEIINLFLAIESAILVGTEISTSSVRASNSRYYRGLEENYFYRPDGLHLVTPQNGTKPFRFAC